MRIVTVLSGSPAVRAQAIALAERPELELSSYDALSNVPDEVVERADLLLIWLAHHGRIEEDQLLRLARKIRLVLVVEQKMLLEMVKWLSHFDNVLFADMRIDRQVAALEMAKLGYMLLPDYARAGVGLDELRLSAVEQLSKRDLDVLLALRQGSTNKEIGDELGLKESVVKACVRSVLARLHFSNRTEAALFALRCQSRLVSIRQASDG